LSLYTYTYAYTRAEAVVDQVDVLFSEAGIVEGWRTLVCNGVRERWLEAVGLYLERDGAMVYEIEATINWVAHTDQAELSFSTDLPGWEDKGSPEAIILGRRLAATAVAEKLVPSYWVRFVASIRNDPVRHEELCSKVGASFGQHPPGWKQTPETRSLPLQDLGEIGLSVRSVL
jgi:hypothetical protein